MNKKDELMRLLLKTKPIIFKVRDKKELTWKDRDVIINFYIEITRHVFDLK